MLKRNQHLDKSNIIRKKKKESEKQQCTEERKRPREGRTRRKEKKRGKGKENVMIRKSKVESIYFATQLIQDF